MVKESPEFPSPVEQVCLQTCHSPKKRFRRQVRPVTLSDVQTDRNLFPFENKRIHYHKRDEVIHETH